MSEMKLKYIRYTTPLGDQVIIFLPTETHFNMANRLGVVDDVVSAGFVSLNGPGALVTSGESVSLGKKSDETDASLLNMWFG